MSVELRGYQLLQVRAKCNALRRADLQEARAIGQRLTAAGVDGEEALLLRAIRAAQAVHEASKAAARCIPRYVDMCHKELAMMLASDLADLGMSRWKAKDEEEAKPFLLRLWGDHHLISGPELKLKGLLNTRNEPYKAQKYMSQALSTLSDPELVLDAWTAPKKGSEP